MKHVVMGLLLVSGAAPADGLRDPTTWPSELRAPLAASGALGDEPAAPLIQQIVVVAGQPFVVSGGRRYPVGARLNGALIERIDDKAVWLRDASGRRREGLYPGIEKRPPSEPQQKIRPAGPQAKPQEKQ